MFLQAERLCYSSPHIWDESSDEESDDGLVCIS